MKQLIIMIRFRKNPSKKTELEPLAHNAWAEAREKQDFKIFKPFRRAGKYCY